MNPHELADTLDVMASEMEYNHVVTDWETASQAATLIRSQITYINMLHKTLNANGIGIGRNILTGEVIPFEEYK